MKKVLVDSSVWVAFFRGQETPETDILDYLLEEGLVCTTGLIMAEIIPSARTVKEFRLLQEHFQALPCLGDPPSMWPNIIEWQYKLKRKGIHGIGIADLIVAIVANEHDSAILTSDKHFKLAEQVMGLELVRSKE